jgi:MFS family permease
MEAGSPDKAVFRVTPVREISRTVWALGLVSMFMDISSEMIHSLLPVFIVSVLGASVLSVGWIEGVAEAGALITKTFSGALSDRLGKRKALAVFGYALGTVTKPFFALAQGVVMVFGARFVDRLGKGVRGAPRDALVADITAPDSRGAAYGLRQSLDTVGAFLGPMTAMALMFLTAGNFRKVFWIAVLPGLIAVTILITAVREPVGPAISSIRKPIQFRDVSALGSAYWIVVMLGSLFTLARFSEAFLLLRAESVGMRVNLIPLVLVLMNAVYAVTAYPVGRLSDRMGRRGLMAAGLLVLIFSDLTLGLAQTSWQVGIGAALWGLHMGLTQGLLAAWVADTSPQNLRATAFGLFGLASGLTTLAASVFAGWLWEMLGAPATFLAGFGFALAALLGYWMFNRSSAGRTRKKMHSRNT